MGEKERDRAFKVCFVEWGKEAPTRMTRIWREGKEHGGKEGKNKGKERKGNMPRLSSLLPRLAYIRYMYVCVSVFQESKSRFIEGIEGIGQPS